MRADILVDSAEFWKHLREDILLAEDHIYIQTLSFEGDSVGKSLSDLLLCSNGRDIRLVIDHYTRFVLSDKFLYTPRNSFSKALHHEAIETVRLIKRLTHGGVGVRFTNPAGPLLMGFARRNHKKIIVIDGKIAYIGGLNFSEHNFAWHDMMLRIEDAGVAIFLREDFLATWNGRHRNTSKQFEGILFYILDGCSNADMYKGILKLLEGAKRRIFIESPYLMCPFFEKLREIRRRGVAVTIIAPRVNNRKFFDPYVRWESSRSGFDLRLYERGMTHLKAMLIDEEFLILGSSNFDYLSCHSQQEIMAVCTDPRLISCFEDRVMREDLRDSSIFEGRIGSMKGWASAFILESMGKLSVLASRLAE